MKKTYSWFVLVFILFSLCGCATRQMRGTQTVQNLLIYQEDLQAVAERYEVELTEIQKNYLQPKKARKIFQISLENAVIEIMILNSSSDVYTMGVESFSVTYEIERSNSGTSFCVDLFVDLINAVSGRKITRDLCQEFLDAPEEKYAATRKGYHKSNGEIIYKIKNLNFFEDWRIYYELYPQEEILSFGGLTRQLHGH